MLGDYLSARRTIMKGQTWCRNGDHYIDAFAGSGRPLLCDGHEQRFVDGSPRVALNLTHPFSTYTFVEMEPRRLSELRNLRSEFPDRKIAIVSGDCNEVIIQYVTPRIRHEHRNRGFVFLDPFGINLAWATIEAIAETRAIEILLNFPTMGLNRAALHNRPDGLATQQVAQMNLVWGSEEWRGLLYEQRAGLWETREYKRAPTRAEHLGRMFIEHRLSKIFPYVTNPMVVKNSHGAPLYCLIFAGHNEKGAQIAEDIFNRRKRRSSASRPPSNTLELGTLPLLRTG